VTHVTGDPFTFVDPFDPLTNIVCSDGEKMKQEEQRKIVVV